MNTIKVTGSYGLPQVALIQATNHMVENLYRDEVEFAKFGITTEQFDELKNLMQNLVSVGTNYPLQKEQYNLKITVSEAQKALVQVIDEIAFKVQVLKGFKSTEYFKHAFAKSINKRDLQSVLTKGAELTAAYPLSAELTPDSLIDKNEREKLHAAYTTLVELGNQYNILKVSKKQTSHTRTAAANALYEKLIWFSNVGKRMWLSRDEALYKSYVLTQYRKAKRTKSETNTAYAA
ncbi:MAG TPA: hypothetical protein DCQ31_18495 [Bacteroidales bacterium]|nr:hypothetical protein [Bacteroidales bacterium]